jgi:hypothetical protein
MNRHESSAASIEQPPDRITAAKLILPPNGSFAARMDGRRRTPCMLLVRSTRPGYRPRVRTLTRDSSHFYDSVEYIDNMLATRSRHIIACAGSVVLLQLDRICRQQSEGNVVFGEREKSRQSNRHLTEAMSRNKRRWYSIVSHRNTLHVRGAYTSVV